MHDVEVNGLQYFVLIAEQKKRKTFLELLDGYGARSIDIVYAHGSMSPSALVAAFGLEAEQGKVMITCLIKNERARELVAVLRDEYNFSQPNTGIAFGIPVEGIAF